MEIWYAGKGGCSKHQGIRKMYTYWWEEETKGVVRSGRQCRVKWEQRCGGKQSSGDTPIWYWSPFDITYATESLSQSHLRLIFWWNITVFKITTVPGHLLLLHTVTSSFNPAQGKPPLEGAGLLQIRILFLIPKQVSEHTDQGDHSDHWPFTREMKQKHSHLSEQGGRSILIQTISSYLCWILSHSMGIHFTERDSHHWG